MNSLHDLLNQLKDQVESLHQKIEELEKSILEEGLQFEIHKNSIPETVAQENRGFEPQGVDLDYPSDLVLKTSDKNITKTLNNIFKVEL
jgi:hypothetical protein